MQDSSTSFPCCADGKYNEQRITCTCRQAEEGRTTICASQQQPAPLETAAAQQHIRSGFMGQQPEEEKG